MFDDESLGAKTKTVALYALLIAFNLLAWVLAFIQFSNRPALIGTAGLAYILGLRHAVDPDHVAAIDNVTRKLMQEGKHPISTGFFFALGHSTIVVAASLLIAFSVGALEAKFEWIRRIGGAIGTSVSAAFLLIVAFTNTAILVSIYRAFEAARCGQHVNEEALQDLLSGRGLLSRALRSLFGVITRSWHMYPLGFLFGLGFDTASEIGLLGISAAQGSAGLPIWSILIFPALFTAAMSLIDTTDGILMIRAYGWAFITPVRKLYYNLTMTIVSILVAVLIGGLEALGLLADKLGLKGSFWTIIDLATANFALLGYMIVAVFFCGWLISVMIYKWRDFDALADGFPQDGNRL
ncbi:HoxN/HupN/NixA family nickel/cobalt transporter [Bradyrhizobium diazoefficiens]